MANFEVGDTVLILNFWPGVVAEVVAPPSTCQFPMIPRIWVAWDHDRIPVEFEPQHLVPIPKNATPIQVEALQSLYSSSKGVS